jgi:hypothetical protein
LLTSFISYLSPLCVFSGNQIRIWNPKRWQPCCFVARQFCCCQEGQQEKISTIEGCSAEPLRCCDCHSRNGQPHPWRLLSSLPATGRVPKGLRWGIEPPSRNSSHEKGASSCSCWYARFSFYESFPRSRRQIRQSVSAAYAGLWMSSLHLKPVEIQG